MNIKKFTSLTMLLTMIVMVYTGLMLFITPPGRVAYWADWKLFGLNKEQYGEIHSTFMVLFIIATILHIYYNWKPLISYMKNSAKQLIVFTKEMVAASVLVLLFLLGTLYGVVPFSSFLEFGDGVKEHWEKDLGTAPYSHAELSSIKSFCKKLGYDLKKSTQILDKHHIQYNLDKSLSQVAKENNISPKDIYEMLKKEFQQGQKKYIQVAGLGKKTIKDVAELIGISSEEFLTQLKTLGIEADENEKLKDAIQRYNQSPMDIMVQLGYRKPN